MFDRNRVVAHTGARYPILQAPMAWIARSQLVSAVSAAGAFGLLETTSADFSTAASEFAEVRRRTSEPFGVNLPIRFLQKSEDQEGRILDWLAESGVRFVTTSAGDPTRYVQRLRDAGMTIYHAVAGLAAAQKAVDAGVDGLIVEGAESAGIRSPDEVHTFVLLQAVRERVEVPIVAAGGIVDGRGMAAAFALGAEGVAMGTRFVASTESPVHPNYKTAILQAGITGTMLTESPPRAKVRALSTSYNRAVAAGERERLPPLAVVDLLYVGGDVDNTAGAAGETAGLIHEIKDVEAIVQDTIQGFASEITRLSRFISDSN